MSTCSWLAYKKCEFEPHNFPDSIIVGGCYSCCCFCFLRSFKNTIILGFSTWTIMSSANRDGFVSSSLISILVSSLCSSYLPVYAEVQEPHVYLQSSHMEVTNLYLGVPTKTTITLINGTLLPTQFHWGKVSELALLSTRSAVLSTRGPCGACSCPPGAPQNRVSLLSRSLPLAPW